MRQSFLLCTLGRQSGCLLKICDRSLDDGSYVVDISPKSRDLAGNLRQKSGRLELAGSGSGSPHRGYMKMPMRAPRERIDWQQQRERLSKIRAERASQPLTIYVINQVVGGVPIPIGAPVILSDPQANTAQLDFAPAELRDAGAATIASGEVIVYLPLDDISQFDRAILSPLFFDSLEGICQIQIQGSYQIFPASPVNVIEVTADSISSTAILRDLPSRKEKRKVPRHFEPTNSRSAPAQFTISASNYTGEPAPLLYQMIYGRNQPTFPNYDLEFDFPVAQLLDSNDTPLGVPGFLTFHAKPSAFSDFDLLLLSRAFRPYQGLYQCTVQGSYLPPSPSNNEVLVLADAIITSGLFPS